MKLGNSAGICKCATDVLVEVITKQGTSSDEQSDVKDRDKVPGTGVKPSGGFAGACDRAKDLLNVL